MLRNKLLRAHAACVSHVLEKSRCVCWRLRLQCGLWCQRGDLLIVFQLCFRCRGSTIVMCGLGLCLLYFRCIFTCVFVLIKAGVIVLSQWQQIDHDHVSRTCHCLFLPFFGIDVRNIIRLGLIICCVVAFEWHQRVG